MRTALILASFMLLAWLAKPLLNALKRSAGTQGGRPPYDAVMMFKILVLQALYGLSDEQAGRTSRRRRSRRTPMHVER